MNSIVLIIDSLVNAGAENTNIRLAKMFQKSGYIVHLVILKDNIDLTIPSNIILHKLNYKKTKTLFRDKIFSKKLKDTLNSINNKKLILGSLGLSHKLMNFIDQEFIFYYVLHGNTTKAKLSKKRGIKKVLKKKEIQRLYSNKRIITVSNGVKDDILSLGIKVKSIQTIYNPFDFEEIKEKAKEKLEIEFPKNYIVHVGRFAKVKRHDILLKAFSKIKNSNMKLILIGDGEEKENIKQLIKELKLESKVILTGFLENPFPIIKKAKLLVLSSENEGFGNVLIEALILNTNIVSTNTLGAQEIMKGELSNQVCKINDENDLTQKVQSSLKNNILLEKYCQPFKEKPIIKKYLSLFTV